LGLEPHIITRQTYIGNVRRLHVRAGSMGNNRSGRCL
jgi:hypothetical protein